MVHLQMFPWRSRAPIYEPVCSEEDGVSAEDLGLLSEEANLPLHRPVAQRHEMYLRILIVITLALTVASSVLFFERNFSIIRKTTPGPRPPYGSPIPPVPLELKNFGPAEIFTERANNRSDAAWEALAGPTINEQGFIYVSNPRTLNLPQGVMRTGGEMYGISMFHQLHCLGAIRNTFWRFMDRTLDPVQFAAMDGDTTAPDFFPDGHGLWHLTHCFNFIRHALQCYGDTTIEVPTLFNGHPVFIGWNTTHQCRTYSNIWDYAVKHS